MDKPFEPNLGRLFKMAVLSGIETAVKLHIRRGDDLNARDGAGMTPLMLAASKNKASVCLLLLAAGADPNLFDLAGRDALAIAKGASAHEAASTLETVIHPEPEPGPELEPVLEPVPVVEAAPVAVRHVPDWDVDDGGWDDLDLSGWEAEEDAAAPGGDSTIAEAAAELHRAISAVVPDDDAEGWADFEAFLPERAAPLPGSQGEEEASRLRRLLLRAVREGSVPESDFSEACADEFGNLNPAWTALLRLVLCELGAETDGRREEGDEPWLADASEAEDEEVSKALDFIQDIESGRNEPARFYSKEMRVGELLSADEEVRLGREMEEGLAEASAALASWPEGLGAVLAAAERVRSGELRPESVSLGSDAGPDGDGREDEAPLEAGEGAADENDGLTREAREFLEAIDEVRSLFLGAGSPVALGEAVAMARLSPSFLCGLARREGAEGASSLFSAAIGRYASARETMVLRNLRLVFSVVKRYQGLGLNIDDLIQEGNIGLIRAVEKYDWRKGFRFSTYATWWIRQQATRSLADAGRTIRLPVHVNEKTHLLRKEIEAVERELGRTPSSTLLAERLGMPLGMVSALRVRMEEPLPLDEPDEFGQYLGDGFADASQASPEEHVERISLIETLGRMLSELDSRAAEVLAFRYGLDGTDSRTLEETGEHFGVTRERIRQIEAKALKKLAHPTRAAILGPFLHPDSDDWDGESNSQEAEEVTSQAQAGHDGEPETKPEGGANPERACRDGLDGVLDSARGLGASVDDGRCDGGCILVCLPSDKYATMRRLARDLVATGFTPLPGMTYRK